jgi:hypothetical protein
MIGIFLSLTVVLKSGLEKLYENWAISFEEFNRYCKVILRNLCSCNKLKNAPFIVYENIDLNNYP